MRQLDLFGFFFETPAKEKKPEDIQPVLKKEGIPEIIVNKEISSSLVDITQQIPVPEALKNPVEINENAGQILNAEENLEGLASFALPENTDPQINPVLDNNKESAGSLPVDEVEVERQISFRQDHDELKTGYFDEDKEVKFEDGKSVVQTENEAAVNVADIKANQKKEPQKRGRKSLEEIEAEVDLIEIPEDEVLFKKQYYPISEVARWFRVNASLLRFWEKEFDILKPKKNGKGDRLFRPEDVKNLQLIYQLLRQRKYTIEGAKEYIKTNKKKADIEMQLANTLQKFKSFLLDLKANL